MIQSLMIAGRWRPETISKTGQNRKAIQVGKTYKKGSNYVSTFRLP